MKNIVIATWYLSDNYGTCLQAYALNQYLKMQKFNCKTLAYGRYYRVTEISEVVSKAKKKLMGQLLVWGGHRKDKPENSLNNSYKKNSAKVFSKNSEIMQRNIALADMHTRKQYVELNKQTDYFVVGGDQLWNPERFTTTYFLPFVKEQKKRLAYGTSFGVDTIPAEMRKKYKNGLSKMQKLAVREESGVKIINEVAGKTAVSVLDPIFLLDADAWRMFIRQESKLALQEERYALCYFVGGFNQQIKWIKRFQENMGQNLKLVILPMNPEDFKEENILLEASMADFLNLLDHAEYVLTDSFHATAFSILFNKNFFNFHRFKRDDIKSQNGRVDQLLDKFNIEKRYYDGDEQTNCVTINWEQVNQRLDMETEKSRDIFLDMLDP